MLFVVVCLKLKVSIHLFPKRKHVVVRLFQEFLARNRFDRRTHIIALEEAAMAVAIVRDVVSVVALGVDV